MSASSSRADSLLAAADAAERAGNAKKAISLYQAALHLAPDNTSAALNLGVLLKYRGRKVYRSILLHALGVDPSLRCTAGRFLDGGKIFGIHHWDAHNTVSVGLLGAECLREVLLSAGYGSRAVRDRLGLSGTYTGNDLLMYEDPDALVAELHGSDRLGCLLLLFALGVALSQQAVEMALGAADCKKLLDLGLLLDCQTPWDLIASPVQIYPLAMNDDDDEEPHDLLLATDFDYESALPTRMAVMPIGYDSLNLVRLAPHLIRETVPNLLDLCTGSGIQALAALANDLAEHVVACDISPRAVRFTNFNAHLNGLDSRLTACVSDVYSSIMDTPSDGLTTLQPHHLTSPSTFCEPGTASDWHRLTVRRPFDAILSNPPFVAVPSFKELPSKDEDKTSLHAQWALYADGGPDGADVLRAIMAGARDPLWLRPGGALAIVTEFPNIQTAAIWLLDDSNAAVDAHLKRWPLDAGVYAELKRGHMDLAIVYNPRHVRDAKKYAKERSDERGWPWADTKVWERSLRKHGVEHMSSGLLFGVASLDASSGRSVPLDAEEDLPLLETAEAGVRSVCDALLSSARQRPRASHTPTNTIFVVSDAAHSRMLAWPGGGAANMEVPGRLVSARNAIHMLPRGTLRQVEYEERSFSWSDWVLCRLSNFESDLLRAHTKEFVDDIMSQFFGGSKSFKGDSPLEGDAEIIASLTAVTSLLKISEQVLRSSNGIDAGGFVSGLALVRPAGHHSTPDTRAPLCAINSVMVAALREAHTTGKTVGVLDVDVHFATGSQRIAMRWNTSLRHDDTLFKHDDMIYPEAGRVIVADVYAAMGPPARFVETVQKEYADLQASGLDEASLKTEMAAEFAAARSHEKEVVDMICDSHLMFPHDKEELNDDALFEATTKSIEHFKAHGVDTVYVSLGFDAAAGDREGAQVNPEGFKRMATALRESGLRLIFALEGGYHIGDLDANEVLSGREEGATVEDVDRFLGTGNFGKCVHAVALALVE